MTRHSERGAIIIQVAAALLGLVAISSIVLDYGIMWSSRSQIQTSADAAALAGAISLTYDNTTPANVKARARQVGLKNGVWAESPDIQTTDISILTCPTTPGLPNTDTCVKADAYRNQGRNNALPTFMANLFGVNNQGVRATATARAVAANATRCLKPWAVADKWFDTQPGGWNQQAVYSGPPVNATAPIPGSDYYIPPTASDAGTGFSAKDDSGNPTFYGYQMMLKLSNPGGGGGAPVFSSGWAMELCLDHDGDTNPCNTPSYNDNIETCTSDTVAISAPGEDCQVPHGSGNYVVDPLKGCLGVKTGSTGNNNATSVANFIANHDPSATWTDGGGSTPWQTGTINTTQSPSSRIVPIAVFDVPDYLAGGFNGSNGVLRVVNLVGFFVEGTCDTVAYKEPYLQCPSGGSSKAAIVGRMVNYPGEFVGSGGTVKGNFGQMIILVR